MVKIEHCVSFLLGKAYQKVSREARDALAGHGVTPVQFATLSILLERDGLSCAEVGARLVLDSATVTGIVDRLEAAGLVERRPDPDGDRRVNRVFVTPEARALRASLDTAMEALNRNMDAALGDAAAPFRAALARIAAIGEGGKG